MKKIILKTKLAVRKETLQTLGVNELGRVAGREGVNCRITDLASSCNAKMVEPK